MGYTRKDVSAGRRLIAEAGRRQWELGDLALRIAPLSADGVRNGSEKILDDFADEIGTSYEVLRQYRGVAAAWPPGTRVPGGSYTLHRELRNDPDREDTLRSYVTSTTKPSYRGLQRYLGKRPTLEISAANLAQQVRQALTEMAAADRVAVTRELLADDIVTADEGVRQEACRVADHDTRAALTTAGFPGGHIDIPGRRDHAGNAAFLAIALASHKLAQDAKSLAEKFRRLDGSLRDGSVIADVTADFRVVRAAMDFCDSAMTGTDQGDWDAALATLLDES
jgi:hypothetical protein